MKKILYLIALLVMYSSCSHKDEEEQIIPIGDCIYQGNLNLASQADVDAFAAAEYCEINGALLIGSDNVETDITDLSGLETLKTIAGSLRIVNNPNLITFHGLENIEDLGTIEIKNNDAVINLNGICTNPEFHGNNPGYELVNNDSLLNLQGLENVTTIVQITVNNCPSFNSFQGIENCTNISFLNIYSCPALESLSALSHLVRLQSLTIWLTPIISLHGLENVVSMDYLELKSNDALTSLNGLGNVEHLSFTCLQNPALQNLEGLESVNKMGGLIIQSNNGLQSLSGLQNVNEAIFITIRENPALQTISHLSSITKIYSSEVNGGGLAINGNHTLTSLDGLQNVTEFRGYGIDIALNSALMDLCAIREILLSGNRSYTLIYGNGNPVTASDISQGNCN